MRILKFRAWDKYKNTFIKDYIGIRPDGRLVIYNIWYDEGDNYCDESWTDIADDNQYIVQQATGVIDRNGKEIYEGDIIKFIDGDDNKESFGYVEWGLYGDGEVEEYVKGIECWMIKGYHLPLSTITNYGVQYNRGRSTNGEPCEIIGNILENSDFLN